MDRTVKTEEKVCLNSKKLTCAIGPQIGIEPEMLIDTSSAWLAPLRVKRTAPTLSGGQNLRQGLRIVRDRQRFGQFDITPIKDVREKDIF